MNRSIILPCLVTAFVALSPAGVALADNPHDGNPSTTGQPGKEADVSNPGVTSPAGFGSRGFANAETHYAGSDGTPSQANANSPHSVSQYDVAGFQWCQHHNTCTSG
jgi:hypothetical protein